MRRQQNIDRHSLQHHLFHALLDSSLMAMTDTKFPTVVDADANIMAPIILSQQLPPGQWHGESISEFESGQLYLDIHEDFLRDNIYGTQDVTFPASFGSDMHNYTMALNPVATLQHCAASPPFRYQSQNNFDSHMEGLGIYASNIDVAPTMYPFTGYQESNFLAEFENSSENNSTPMSMINEEDETDKPYAKLIYEALMQAPGHRMMLREIYDWFVANTSKPQDSGSNGWQNSIRHNLSMNQAFENDKSEATTRGHARKANSVWVLTADAIKNGVQSTTRYRKNGSGKRAVHRTPAPQRQRSGARGGRAARRSAARLRKEDQGRCRAVPQALPPFDMSPFRSPFVTQVGRSPEETSMCSYQPLTPVNEDQFMSTYNQPGALYSFGQSALPIKVEHEHFLDEGLWKNDPPCYGDFDHGLDELRKFESD